MSAKSFGTVELRCLLESAKDKPATPVNSGIVWISKSNDKIEFPVHDEPPADVLSPTVLMLSPDVVDAPSCIVRQGEFIKIRNISKAMLLPKHDGTKNIGWSTAIPVSSEYTYRLRDKEREPLTISHKGTPLAYVFIAMNQYAVVSDSEGKVVFKNAPLGKLTISMWLPECRRVDAEIEIGMETPKDNPIEVTFMPETK